MTQSPVTIEVPVIAVPSTYELKDGNVYLYRDGRLWRCGLVDCILGHLNTGKLEYAAMAIRDHFDGQWAGHGGNDYAYVVTYNDGTYPAAAPREPTTPDPGEPEKRR